MCSKQWLASHGPGDIAIINERGSILLYVTGSSIVMALFVGLAIDGGWTTYVMR